MPLGYTSLLCVKCLNDTSNCFLSFPYNTIVLHTPCFRQTTSAFDTLKISPLFLPSNVNVILPDYFRVSNRYYNVKCVYFIVLTHQRLSVFVSFSHRILRTTHWTKESTNREARITIECTHIRTKRQTLDILRSMTCERTSLCRNI